MMAFQEMLVAVVVPMLDNLAVGLIIIPMVYLIIRTGYLVKHWALLSIRSASAIVLRRKSARNFPHVGNVFQSRRH
jgi:hypothetical protein